MSHKMSLGIGIVAGASGYVSGLLGGPFVAAITTASITSFGGISTTKGLNTVSYLAGLFSGLALAGGLNHVLETAPTNVNKISVLTRPLKAKSNITVSPEQLNPLVISHANYHI